MLAINNWFVYILAIVCFIIGAINIYFGWGADTADLPWKPWEAYTQSSEPKAEANVAGDPNVQL